MGDQKKIERLNRILRYNLEVYEESIGRMEAIIAEKDSIIKKLVGSDKGLADKRVQELKAILKKRDTEIERLKEEMHSKRLQGESRRVRDLKDLLEARDEEVRVKDEMIEKLKETILDKNVELKMKEQEIKRLRSRLATLAKDVKKS
jgi:type I site-specific restriction endonuclease